MVRQSFLSALIVAALLADLTCGSPSVAAAPAVPPDAVVTLDGPKHRCAVAAKGKTEIAIVPCAKVAAYLQRTLRLARGSFVELATLPDVDVSEYDHTLSELRAAGFRPTPGVHVGFLTEPHIHDH